MTDPALMAAECLLKAGAFPANPLSMLSRSRGVWLMTGAEAGEEALSPEEDARLFRLQLKDGRVMYALCYREDAGESRLRFSLAHELGHIALRHRGDMPGADPETRRREEREAQAFAAALLLPPPLLRHLQGRCPLTPALVSAVFGVSRAMAALSLSRPLPALPADVEQRVIERFGEEAVRRAERGGVVSGE